MNIERRIFEVSGWRNTSSKETRRTLFGLRLGTPERDRWVMPKSEQVTLELEGQAVPLQVRLSPAFWRKCPEFKHPDIGTWIQAQAIQIPWSKGNPPRFQMECLSGTHFRARCLTEVGEL